MKKIHRDHHGFGSVELLLVVVIIGLIGFVGWYVWHAKQNTNDALKPNDSTIVQSKTSAKSTEPTSKQTTTEPAASGPAIVYSPDASFSNADKAELQTKLIKPVENYYKDTVASISIEVYSGSGVTADYKYTVRIVLKDSTSDSSLYGSKANGLETWQPAGE